ncbi:unnamed protein product [Diplocarpon coronariae]
MAAPVTSVAYITTKPGIDLEGTGTAAQAWKEALATLPQQNGFQSRRWGRTMENVNLVMLFVGWDSHESHLKFIASPGYAAFKSSLAANVMDGVHFHHVTFQPLLTKIIDKAPVVEFATFFDTTDDLQVNVPKFFEAAGTPEGYHGCAWGPSIQTDVGTHADGSLKGKAVVLLIGWDSKEAHLKFMETETFSKNIGLLREGMKGAEVFHVVFKAA